MSVVALCPRCRRETGPQLKGPSWHKDVHRAAARDMLADPDPRAERIRARKARKAQSLRSVTRTAGFTAVAKLFLRPVVSEPASEECPDCQRIQNSRKRNVAA